MKNRIKRTLSQALSINLILTLLGSHLLITGSLFFLLKFELAKRDKNVAIIRSHEVCDVIELHGIDYLKTKDAAIHLEDFNRLLIVVTDALGNKIFEKMPVDLKNFSQEEIATVLKESLDNLGAHTVNPKLPLEETIEIFSQNVLSYRVAVGFDTDSSEDFANLYFKSAIYLVLITSLLSALYVYFFTIRKLKPINQLIETVQQIQLGNLTPIPMDLDSKYELYELTRLFNEMILHIRKLIASLQGSIDSIAHDLRTPLTHISLKLESLINSDQQISKETFGDLLEETNEITKLVNTLLEITEADSKSLTLKKEAFPLRPLLQECIDLYEYVLEDKKSKIDLYCEPEITLKADRNRIKRVFANLIDNAIKFCGDSPTISIRCAQIDSAILITIEDNGVGMSTDDINKIWQRLYRGDQSRTTKGMGLGLSFVKSILDAHGWTITVESEINQGSKFKIEATTT